MSTGSTLSIAAVAGLAVLQGVAEFLPISSSGHLVLAQNALGLDLDEGGAAMTLVVFLHTGTLISVLLFYRRRIAELVAGLIRGDRPAWRYALCLLLSAIPAVALYLVAGDSLESAFSNVRSVAICLCVTGAILCAPELVIRRRANRAAGDGPDAVTAPRALLTGVAQAFAMLPGISRSGSTITAARLCGIPAKAAAEFSFLMSLPLLFGATVLELFKFFKSGAAPVLPWSTVLFGVLVAAAVGYASLSLLVGMLRKGSFWIFGVYCIVIGVCALLFL